MTHKDYEQIVFDMFEEVATESTAEARNACTLYPNENLSAQAIIFICLGRKIALTEGKFLP